MDKREVGTRLPWVFSIIVLLVLAGCSESPVAVESTSDTPDSERTQASAREYGLSKRAEKLAKLSKKLRHLHLLERAVIPGAPGKTTSTDSLQMLVGVADGYSTSDSVLQKVLDKYKILNRFQYNTAIRGMAVTVANTEVESFVADLDGTSSVGWVEPDPALPVDSGTSTTTTVSQQQIPWGIYSVGADASWAVSGDGQGAVGVDLYIVDTGVSHADLNVVECIEFPTRKGGAVPCTSTDDLGGHGTEVAGVAAAVDDVDGIVGVAPGARVHAVKVMRENGNTVLGSLIAVVDHLTAHKLANPTVPMVVNISLGSDVRTTRYNGLDEAIRASIAAGVVYIIAAGNDAIDVSTVSPAHVAEAITVAAHDESRQQAWFSNYGPGIDLFAPGVDVLTLKTPDQAGPASGTSIAAPFVAGAAALLLAQDPTLSPAALRDLLLSRAQADVTGISANTTTRGLFVQ